LAIGLRYAMPAAQGKTKTTQHKPGSYEPISSNWLALFCSASLAPYSAPFTCGILSGRYAVLFQLLDFLYI